MTRIAHGRATFAGRDPAEEHRAATPLELLYDLTLVVAFGTAADELAHMLAEGHATAGVGGFALAIFAISWAWLNYTWLASAYDTDDWVFRLATMTQMGGVVVLALGIQPALASIADGGPFDGRTMVAGYVVMRIAQVGLWARVAREDPPRRPAALRYIATLGVAQLGWVVYASADLSLTAAGTWFCAGLLVELVGPALAERAARTPWHPRHIAERYGLLVLITLGEGVLGTVAAVRALVHGDHGWTAEAAGLTVAGVGLAFACWWAYFGLPWAQMLADDHRQAGAFGFGYGHLLLFGALVAMGAGLHVAAYALEGTAVVGPPAVVACVAAPVGVFLVALHAISFVHRGVPDRVDALLLALAVAVPAGTVLLAVAGLGTTWCLLVLLLAPSASVLGQELAQEDQRSTPTTEGGAT